MDIKELGEFGLINKISSKFKNKRKSTILGIGDDCAILNSESQLILLSSDMLVEGIHFDLSFTPIKHLGYKSVVVNLSDIYSMNAEPKQILINIAISSKFSVEAIDEFYEGVSIACDEYSVDLVGGDTTSSVSGLIISCSVVGYSKETSIVRRNGAKNNDIICVSGDLGRSFLGLKILQREKVNFIRNPNIQPSLNEYKDIIEKQLRPRARKDVFDFFKDEKITPNSMIDISDGLSSDLLHLSLNSNLGFKIFEDKLPIDKNCYKISDELKMDAVSCALNGGEEYELLFSLNPSDYEKIKKKNFDISPIGFFTKKNEKILVLNDESEIDLNSDGWNHFT